MNRTTDKLFFRTWDMAKELDEAECQLKPKEMSIYYATVEAFFDEYGYYPCDSYQDAIRKWQERFD